MLDWIRARLKRRLVRSLKIPMPCCANQRRLATLPVHHHRRFVGHPPRTSSPELDLTLSDRPWPTLLVHGLLQLLAPAATLPCTVHICLGPFAPHFTHATRLPRRIGRFSSGSPYCIRTERYFFFPPKRLATDMLYLESWRLRSSPMTCHVVAQRSGSLKAYRYGSTASIDTLE